MTTYLCNAFSANMLPEKMSFGEIHFERIHEDDAQAMYDHPDSVDAIGHEDTAAIVSDIFGMHVPTARVNVSLKPGDRVILAQYIGPRLPPGTTTLPDGARIDFILFTLGHDIMAGPDPK